MKIWKWLDKNFEEALCGLLLIAVMLMLFGQVVVRFTLGYGLTFSEELSRFMFLYLVYFGASLVALKGAHVRVTAHLQYLPRSMQLVFLLLSDLLWLGFNAVVIYQGFRLIDGMALRPVVSGALLIDLRYVYVATPLGFSLMTFRIIQRWVRHIRGTFDILTNQPIEKEEERVG